MTQRINTVLFFLMLFATLITPWDSRKWLEFSDTEDYIHQSKIPLTTREFWAPHHSGTFYPRPFTVPLLYKLAGGEPARIVIMQKFIHCLSAWFLVFSLLLLIGTEVFSCLLMIFIYMLMSWWTISGWTNQVLSESISLSLLFCWIASFILAWKRKRWYYWLAHVLITILFSFTRDLWPYLLVFFYLLVSFAAWLQERPLLVPALLMISVAFILFLVQQNTAKTGDRYRLPLINTIAARIISNHEYTAWFKSKGMPCTDSLEIKYRKIDVNVDTDRHKIWDLYYNRNYESLWIWIHDKGKTEYMKFMLTHPAYTLLFKESKQQRQRIFAYDLWYSGEVAGYSKSMQKLFPIFNLWWLCICNFLLLIQFFRRKKLILIFPVILSLVFLMNVFLAYNADALEVERHLFITMVVIQLIVFISLAILGDSLINRSTNTKIS
ncbi:MAG: hypothetical protein NTY96_13460 [Bacteroidetes bacterium]|nr:hypothetical protein [Bacteroidota bacterium]